MSSELIPYLRDRYAAARKAEEGKRRVIPSPFDGHDVIWESDYEGQRLLVDGHPYPVEKYTEIATESAADPFVIADLDAKEEILQTCETYLHEYEGGPDPVASAVLRSLARPYQARSDFDATWLSA